MSLALISSTFSSSVAVAIAGLQAHNERVGEQVFSAAQMLALLATGKEEKELAIGALATTVTGIREQASMVVELRRRIWMDGGEADPFHEVLKLHVHLEAVQNAIREHGRATGFI